MVTLSKAKSFFRGADGGAPGDVQRLLRDRTDIDDEGDGKDSDERADECKSSSFPADGCKSSSFPTARKELIAVTAATAARSFVPTKTSQMRLGCRR